MSTISIVIPVFNEGPALSFHIAEILAHLNNLPEISPDVLLVDDGSTDDTVAQARQICEQNPQVSLLCLSRHFGKEAAIHAGLACAQGDSVLVMDSDLQHPPELIPKMVQLWRQGIAVVEGHKNTRGQEPCWYGLLTRMFYSLFDLLTGINLGDQSDFKLMDRRVVNAYLGMPERKRFFRGMIHWLGYPSARLPFDVPLRQHGRSAWSFWRLLSYSVSALTSFSSISLQFISVLGAVTFVVSALLGGLALYQKLAGQAVSGFTTVILLILFIGSLLMFSLGLIGVYLANIYEEVKGRPDFVIDWEKSLWSKHRQCQTEGSGTSALQ